MIDIYPWFAAGSSIFMVGLFAAHALDASARYRAHHDDRAALDLFVSVALLATAIGLSVSASASFLDVLGVAGRSELRNVGLGIVRGALFTTATVLLMVDRRLGTARTPRTD